MSDRRSGRALLLVAALGLFGCGSDATGPGESSLTGSPEVASFVDAVNAHRRSVGCSALTWHEGVALVAETHSQDMVDRNFFGHTNPDGEDPFDRLREAGISWSGGAGENIAYGTASAETVLQLWLDSPGHRANIENCAYTHHGVGLVGTHWTHVFVTNPS